MNQSKSTNNVYIIMGVSGSGKSVVANRVAQQLDCAFLDGDFLHPRDNITKMAAGQALNDDDRAPWLASLADVVFAMQRTNKVSIIVCSALKKSYRERLRKNNNNLYFIYLKGEFELIENRLKARKGHFFKPSMLISQFESLQEPTTSEVDVFRVDINQSLEGVVKDTINFIQRLPT